MTKALPLDLLTNLSTSWKTSSFGVVESNSSVSSSIVDNLKLSGFLGFLSLHIKVFLDFKIRIFVASIFIFPSNDMDLQYIGLPE